MAALVSYAGSRGTGRPSITTWADEGPPWRIGDEAAVAQSGRYTNASAVSAGAGPYFSGAIVKLARPWLTLRTAFE